MFFVGVFSGVMGMMTLIFSSFSFYVETVGFLSLAIESLLGTPQAISNFRRHSCEGMSPAMIGGWFLGDSFKTVWFIINGEPAQFLMCGIVQLAVDVVILWQYITYRSRS